MLAPKIAEYDNKALCVSNKKGLAINMTAISILKVIKINFYILSKSYCMFILSLYILPFSYHLNSLSYQNYNKPNFNVFIKGFITINKEFKVQQPKNAH